MSDELAFSIRLHRIPNVDVAAEAFAVCPKVNASDSVGGNWNAGLSIKSKNVARAASVAFVTRIQVPPETVRDGAGGDRNALGSVSIWVPTISAGEAGASTPFLVGVHTVEDVAWDALEFWIGREPWFAEITLRLLALLLEMLETVVGWREERPAPVGGNLSPVTDVTGASFFVPSDAALD